MMGGKWIEYTVGDNTLAIANVGEEWKPSDQGTGAALEVEDFDEAINQLRSQGVRFAAEPLKRRVVTWRWCKIRTETSS